MKSEVLKENLPLIQQIVNTCENTIFEKTGIKVNLILYNQTPLETIQGKALSLVFSACVCWQVDIEYIAKRDRKQSRVAMRSLLFHLLRYKLNMSYVSITKVISAGGYDHATVIHAIQKVEKHLQVKDELIMSLYDKIKHLYNAEVHN